MTIGSKEFIDIMDQFEKDMKSGKMPYVSGGLNRESKELWSQGHVYANGHVNDAFRFYRHGYAFGRCTYMN